MGLDRLLRGSIRNGSKFDIVETLPASGETEKRIVIFDCRRHLRGLTGTPNLKPGAGQSNLGLIDAQTDSRQDIYLAGFADFLSWPLVAPELHVRLLAQCRAQSLKDPAYRYSRVAMVERSCAYMAENIGSNVSIRALADMSNTNHNTLNATFKREMGLPPSAWQRKLRLESAARQLRLTNTPVSVIAADFGYDLPCNFTTAFRRHFGVTPYNYRNTENYKN
ncbi:helix-turn-helix domain-containing protein [Pseudohoeflea suaedae]|nr:AraC family transcriptional regulator [Pseudohoeflea suaedae]